MIIGIDIGLRTIKVAALKDGRLLDYQIAACGLRHIRRAPSRRRASGNSHLHPGQITVLMKGYKNAGFSF